MQSNNMEVMAPIVEHIYDYFHKLYPDDICKSEKPDTIQVNYSENIITLSAAGSHVIPFTEVLDKIDNHNVIQETITSQTVSNYN